MEFIKQNSKRPSFIRAHKVSSYWLRSSKITAHRIEPSILNIICLFYGTFEFKWDNSNQEFVTLKDNQAHVVTKAHSLDTCMLTSNTPISSIGGFFFCFLLNALNLDTNKRPRETQDAKQTKRLKKETASFF